MLIPLNSNKTLNVNELRGHPKSALGEGREESNNRKDPESRARTSAKSLPGCHFLKPQTPMIPVHQPIWRLLGGNTLILVPRVPWSSNPQDETNTKKSRHLAPRPRAARRLTVPPCR